MKVIGNLTKDAIIRAAVSEGISVTQEIGSSVTFESAITSYVTVVYDSSNQKIVIGYRDQGNSTYGTAIVGTVSGSSISFGTPTVFESATVSYMSGAFDSNNNKVVFCFRGSSTYGRSVVGTVSGTSISFGSVATFESAAIEDTGTAYDANAQRIVVAYRDDGNSFYGTAAVGTVSGTSISFGTPVVYEAATSQNNTVVYDSTNNKVVIGFKVSSTGQGIVGTVSGTSISFGSKTQFESGNLSYITGTYDSTNQKVVFAYQDSSNSSYGTAVVGTVSGTSISFGTPVVFNEGNSAYFSATFDAGAGRILITYSDDSNGSKGESVVGTVSGTSITFSDMALFKDASADFVSSAYDANSGRVVIGFRSPGNSNYGEAVVFKVGYSQATGGTIADGKAVIVNANGTVSTVSETAASSTTPTVFDGEANYYAAAFDSTNNKIVIVYEDVGNSSYGTAIVATVSGDTISFGTPVVYESAQSQYNAIDYDVDNDKFIINYKDVANSNRGTAIVGTVSGTSISFGSVDVFETGNTFYIDVVYDTVNDSFLTVFSDGGNSFYGKARAGSISGTSIVYGSTFTFESASTEYIRAALDSNAGKVVIAYRDGGNSNYGTAIVATINPSDDSVTFGSPVVFDTVNTPGLDITFDSTNNKIVIAYENSATNGKAVVGTVSGTSISFGTPVVFENADVENISASFDSNANKVIISYMDQGNSNYGTVISGTVSGDSISFDDPLVFEEARSEYMANVFDSNANKTLIAYRDDGNLNVATSTLFSPKSTTLTSENFVGFMDGAALDGTNGEILSSCSIARNQTSLTAGQTYFVTPAGALSETAGSPSVTAGTAISSTEIIVKG